MSLKHILMVVVTLAMAGGTLSAQGTYIPGKYADREPMTMPPTESEFATEVPHAARELARWNEPYEVHPAGVYEYQFLPKESLYPFYIADKKASRLGSIIQHGHDDFDDLVWDVSLGGRFGLIRYTDNDPEFPRGWQVDIEGAGLVRLDLRQEHDVRAADFRAGLPITYSFGRFQTRFGYYHLSSHLGDEFLLKNPGFPRVNYSRDVLFVGGSLWLSRSTRIYGEAGWAFYSDISEPWEFQFGIESAPYRPTGLRGAPYYAIGTSLRQEVNFSGNFVAQVGWAWRAWDHSGMLRTGLHYYNGKSSQFSFYDSFEEFVGWGLWYDF